MKKIVIAVSGLFLVAMTACNKAEMPAPQSSAAQSHQALAREGGATPTQSTPAVSVTPPKPDR
jgi:hypothetical protein